MANEISTLTDLNGVTHDIEDSTARSATQTLDGQAVKSVNGQTPTAGAVLIGAGNIGYDNTSSGMTADDVQEAVDELKTALNGKQDTLTFDNTPTASSLNPVTSDGIKTALDAKANDSAVVKSVNSVNPTSGNVTLNAVNIPADGYGDKVVSGNPIEVADGLATNANDITATMEPIQDLHGYANPWPAGGGKNLLHTTGESKSENGTTFTVNADGTVTVSGTPSVTTYLAVDSNIVLPNGQYIMSGPVNGSGSTFDMYMSYKVNGGVTQYLVVENGDSEAFNIDDTISILFVAIRIRTGFSGSTTTIYPMIRKSTDASGWEPYSNICPISGRTEVSVKRTGFNWWDEEWENGDYSSSTGVKTDNSSKVRNKNLVPVLPNTQYYCALPSSLIALNVYWYDANKQFVFADTSYGIRCDSTFTVPSGIYYMAFSTFGTSYTTYNHDISINYPSTETEYHAYEGSTATISLGQTVYGGTLNVSTGELVVDRVKTVLDGSVDPFLVSSVTNNTIIAQFMPSGLGVPAIMENGYIASDKLKTVTSSITGYDAIRNYWENYGRIMIFLYNKELYSISDVSNWLSNNPVEVCYELATPLTVQLTPAQLTLLEGYNYITTDADSLTLNYDGSEASNVQKEIKGFETNIDRLAGSIAQIETSPATATHAVNTYLVWNSRLYKVISAIAVGESLSLGTNISPTTIMAELLALTA